MREFKVLPTNPDFQALTESQIGFILENMEKDVQDQKAATQGYDPRDSYYDDSEDWWYDSIEDFDISGGLDITDEEIQAQIEEMMDEEDLIARREAIDSSKDWAKYMEEEGNEESDRNIQSVINENLRKAREDAERLSSKGESDWGKPNISEEEREASRELNEETEKNIEEAYRIFEGEDLDDEDEGMEEYFI